MPVFRSDDIMLVCKHYPNAAIIRFWKRTFEATFLHLFKEKITEGLCKFPIFHQQEVAQSFKMSFHAQLHKEVVHHCLVHQRHTGDRNILKTDSRLQGCWTQKNTDTDCEDDRHLIQRNLGEYNSLFSLSGWLPQSLSPFKLLWFRI